MQYRPIFFLAVFRAYLPYKLPVLPPKYFVGPNCYVLRYARQIFSWVPNLHKRRISQPVLGFDITVRASAFWERLIIMILCAFQTWLSTHRQYASLSEPKTTSRGLKGKQAAPTAEVSLPSAKDSPSKTPLYRVFEGESLVSNSMSIKVPPYMVVLLCR